VNVAGKTPDEIAERVIAALGEDAPAQGRRLIAVAGPPASGKTTLAHVLHQRLVGRGVPAGLLAMDGFHLDNSILERRGLLTRKGAPETFDLDGFAALLERVHRGDPVIAPTFDRRLDKSIAGVFEIGAETSVIVVEGNYLLLDEPGWRDLRRFWDDVVFLDVPEDVLEARLLKRWRDHGLSEHDARTRAEGNDLPNATRIVRNSTLPDGALRLTSDQP
jgi:fructokinase